MSEHTPQFALLRQQRFGPFFATQFWALPTTICSSSR